MNEHESWCVTRRYPVMSKCDCDAAPAAGQAAASVPSVTVGASLLREPVKISGPFTQEQIDRGAAVMRSLKEPPTRPHECYSPRRRGEPVAWYTPLIGNYAHVVWGKRPDTPMEWAPLYAAPAVAQPAASVPRECCCKVLRKQLTTNSGTWHICEQCSNGYFLPYAAPAVAQEKRNE